MRPMLFEPEEAGEERNQDNAAANPQQATE